MKADYKHDQMVSTIVIRCFPRLIEDLDLLLKQQPERFENRAHVARSAVIFALNRPEFCTRI